MKTKQPEKLSQLIYALTKHAAKNCFVEFLEQHDITEQEYDEISEHWKENGITPYI